VQILKPNELGARKSGLLSRSATDALAESSLELFEYFMLNIITKSEGNISFKLASEVSSSMVSGLMAPIYGQLNPEIIGSDHRDLNVALEYGTRLAENSKNAKKSSVTKLVREYPSHDFIIDDDEAKTLFSRVETPKDSLYELLGFLGSIVYDESRPVIVKRLNGSEAEDEEDEHGEKSADSGEDRRDDEQPKEASASVGNSGEADRESDSVASNRVERDHATGKPSVVKGKASQSAKS
jgi:hypothetical protein